MTKYWPEFDYAVVRDEIQGSNTTEVSFKTVVRKKYKGVWYDIFVTNKYIAENGKLFEQLMLFSLKVMRTKYFYKITPDTSKSSLQISEKDRIFLMSYPGNIHSSLHQSTKTF